jgi:hypothetical protein
MGGGGIEDVAASGARAEATGVPAFGNAVHAEKKSVADITPKDFERQYVTRGQGLTRHPLSTSA